MADCSRRDASGRSPSSLKNQDSNAWSVLFLPRWAPSYGPGMEGQMRVCLRRREFIAGLGGAVAWPIAARAQQGDRVRRIGRNLRTEYRWIGGGRIDRIRAA